MQEKTVPSISDSNICKEWREKRQQQNDALLFDAIKKLDKKTVMQHSNNNELERVLSSTNLSLETLLEQCAQNDVMNILLSGRISKKASRQGTKDEEEQLQICNIHSQKYGIQLQKLNTTDFRPKKTGEILSKTEMKKRGVQKDDCLKSFDARITGKMYAWVFAKVVFGTGGHQDNVFEEADQLCKWVETYHQNEDTKYIFLIDTDLQDKWDVLKTKYQEIKNIMITNHHIFQKYITEHYILLGAEEEPKEEEPKEEKPKEESGEESPKLSVKEALEYLVLHGMH